MAIINDLSARYANDVAADAAFVAAGWAKSEGVMYYDTTLNQFKRWDAVLSAWVFDAGTISGGTAFPGIETMQALFVDQGTNVAQNGSATSPYHSIASAYAAAKLLAPTVTKQIAIIIMGGTYDEVLTMDTAYIHLVGQGINSTIITNDVAAAAAPTVYINSGVVGYVRVQGMTIRSRSTTQHALRINSSLAFITDVFVTARNHDATSTCLNITGANIAVEFKRLFIDGNDGAYHWSAIINYASGTVTFQDCNLGAYGGGYFNLQSAPKIRFIACQFFTNPIHAGNTSAYIRVTTTANVTVLECIGCYFAQTSYNGIYAEVGCTITVVGCEFDTASYPIEIQAAAVILRVVGCSFKTNAALDIYSAANLTTPAEVVGNRMEKGMYQTVRTKNPIKNVGGDHDFYYDLPNAMASINAHGCIVKLHADVTITAAITPGDFRQEIDGQGLYSLTRSGGGGNAMFTLNSAQHLRVRGLRLIEGDINVTGNTAVFEGVDCFFDKAMINITGGTADTLVQLDHCDSIGDADVAKYCIQTTDADPLIRIDDCYLEGGEAMPAINDTAANPNYKVVNSDLIGWPGDPGIGPMVSTGAPNYVSHHNAYITVVTGFVNLVGTPYDVFNSNIGMRRYPLV
jgi:hypothetical protein